MNELVVFDIDNTLLKGQAQHEFLKYARRSRLIGLFPYIKINLWFAAYKLGLSNNPKDIMEYAFGFLKGWTKERFDITLGDFFEKDLKSLIFPEALNIIKEHKSKEREVIFISNIIEPLVAIIAKHCEIESYKGTPLETVNNLYTGKLGIKGIMYGDNKFDSLESFIQGKNYSLENIWGYGDHISDAAILSKIGHPCAVNPSRKLFNLAERSNWPILRFELS